MAGAHPEVRAVWGLRNLFARFRDFELPVGADGRTRCGAGAFGTVTGRCRPRAAECLLLWPRWTRGLVRPPPGRALALLDYAQQECLVAAALSGDGAMLADYAVGDCYLALGRGLGLVPPGGTAETHGRQRELCKAVALATLYGQQAPGLARQIGRPETEARDLLRRHRERHGAYWRWSDATVDFARCHGWLRTRLGWRVWVGRGTREAALRNWRVQATAAEVLRHAACLVSEAGVVVNATLHDALLVEADEDAIDSVAEGAGRLMVRASLEVLGAPLRVTRAVVRHPDRLLDERGRAAWDRVWAIAAGLPAPVTGDGGVLSRVIAPPI
jgi:hypothetical protein